MAEIEPTGQVAVENRGMRLGFTGLYEVIFSPTSFFEKLKNNPQLLVPWVVLGVMLLAAFWGMADVIARSQIEAMEARGQQLPPGFSADQMKIWTIIPGTVIMALSPLIIAAIAAFFGNFIMAGKTSFKKILSVCLYGEIIYAVGMLVAWPLVVAKDSIAVSFSLAVLVADKGPQSLIYTVLSKISVFHIWEVIVLGMGLAIMYNFPRNKGYVLSVITIGLIALVHIGFAAMGLAGG